MSPEELASLPLLRAVPSARLAEIARVPGVTFHTYPPGAFLLAPGEERQGLYLLVEATAEITCSRQL